MTLEEVEVLCTRVTGGLFFREATAASSMLEFNLNSCEPANFPEPRRHSIFVKSEYFSSFKRRE